jgi:hypothetical protein
MNQVEMLMIVQRFSRNGESEPEKMKVIQVADSKTMHVETIGEIGRSILFNEYIVDGNTYWAGYSSRSDTVFVSKVTRG